MARVSKLDLTGVPWPINLLKCSQHTQEMGFGDRSVIVVDDEEIKNCIILILKSVPELRHQVSTAENGIRIRVIKEKAKIEES